MRKYLTGLLLLLPFLGKAQFSDSVNYFVRLAASGNINRTAAGTAYLLANDSRFSIRDKRTTFNAAANWTYGKQDTTLTNNDFTATADINRYTSTNFYYWGLGSYTTSVSLNINRQLQTGVGVAYNVVNSENAWLNLSEGILYEASSLVRNGADEDDRTSRNSFRLSYRFVVKKAVTFNGVNYLQNSLSDGGDYIIRANNSVAYKLNKWIALTASLIYNQVRRTGAENLLFTYGIALENYF